MRWMPLPPLPRAPLCLAAFAFSRIPPLFGPALLRGSYSMLVRWALIALSNFAMGLLLAFFYFAYGLGQVRRPSCPRAAPLPFPWPLQSDDLLLGRGPDVCVVRSRALGGPAPPSWARWCTCSSPTS